MKKQKLKHIQSIKKISEFKKEKFIYFTDFIFIQYTEMLSHLITVILELDMHDNNNKERKKERKYDSKNKSIMNIS